MLPNKRGGGDSQSRPEVAKASVGNTVGSRESDAALRELGQVMEESNISLKFTKDAETGKIVIEMIDQKSGETLLQIPNVAALHVAATLSKLQGKIFNVKA